MAGLAKVMAQPRQMVAKISMEMNTIWLRMIPYLQPCTINFILATCASEQMSH